MRIPIGRIRHEVRVNKITRIGQLLNWVDEYGDGFDEKDWANLFGGRPSDWYKRMYSPNEIKFSLAGRIAEGFQMHEEEVIILIAGEIIHHCSKILEKKNKKKPPDEPIIMAS